MNKKAILLIVNKQTGTAEPTEIDASSFMPDRHIKMTIEEAEKQLPKFKFRGIGWYIVCDGYSSEYHQMLVIPCRAPNNDQLYNFFIYHHDAAMAAFNWIYHIAPILVDERPLVTDSDR